MERVDKKFCTYCERLTVMVLATVQGVPYWRCMLCLNLLKENLEVIQPLVEGKKGGP